jgi:hypothetical protein
MSMATDSHPTARPHALRLVDVLRQLPERELDSLVDRLRIAVDESKRIDVPSQVARALLALPEVRDVTQLPGPTRELLFRIAEAHGVLEVDRLPPAVEPLVMRGIVFVRKGTDQIELVLPIAYMLQMRTWEGEDPRGVRALLAQCSSEVAATIAAHYLGRPATPPVALSLEPAWEVLATLDLLRREVEQLAPLERKLLRSIEEVGGEVDTEELLDLEREPLRLRGATGATPSRRGVGFALERRGFLVPIHPNRHVIPTEVATVVGAQRRAEREAQRRDILTFVLGDDHAPRRARFAEDPLPLAVAMALTVRDPAVEVRAGIGTPRSLISKFATRFGRSPESVAMIASLSRAVGLWDPSAINTSSPPGSSLLEQLGRLLFEAWRRGGAWDEARPDGEMLRVSTEVREASSVGVIREIVLDALSELGDGRWAPWEAVAAYVRADSRTPGVARLIDRWAQRAGLEPMTPAEIARRVALDSLHVLGVVDLGDPESDDDEGMPTLRITPRGRAYLEGEDGKSDASESRFLDHQLLRIGEKTKIGQVMALAPFVEIGSVTGQLDLSVTQQTLALALSAGYDTEIIKARLEAVALLPDPIARLLVQASAVIGRAEFVSSQGFLWVDDPEIREMLRTRRSTADLFVEASPPGGLLIAAGVDIDRLARRCRALGVEVLVEGEVFKTRSVAPGSRSSGRSPSSGGMAAVGSSARGRPASARPATSRSSSTVAVGQSGPPSSTRPGRSTAPPSRRGGPTQ